MLTTTPHPPLDSPVPKTRTKWQPSIHVLTTKHPIGTRESSLNGRLRVRVLTATCSVLEVGLRSGLVPTEDETRATLIWTDGVATVSRLLLVGPWQRLNHFPGMQFVCHKDYLARTLGRMKAWHRSEYSFSPRTWSMSTQTQAFLAKKRTRQAWYIAKPSSKSRGVGIYLFSDPSDYVPSTEFEMVVQQYIDRPFLIDGFKFDLRVYALVTHCDPLRVYVYREGLARFATDPYTRPTSVNRSQIYMHLTNYSVNKKSANFVDGAAGSKRSLTWTLKHLDSLGLDGSGQVWSSIKAIIAKSLIAIKPELTRQFRSCFPKASTSPCFELLGFDVLLDSKLKPYILEVNHSPSLGTETAIDHELKGPLLHTVMSMVLGKPGSLNPSLWTRASLAAAKHRLYRSKSEWAKRPGPPEDHVWEMDHRGLFELVLPDDRYGELCASAEKIFRVPETITSRGRLLETLANTPTRVTTPKDPVVKKQHGLAPTSSVVQGGLRLRTSERIAQFVNKRRDALALRYGTAASALVSVQTLQVLPSICERNERKCLTLG